MADSIFYQCIAELKEICSSAVNLPPAASPNVLTQLTTVQGTSQSFIENINNKRLQLPMLIYNFGDFVPDVDLALNNLGEMWLPGSIIYVCRKGGKGNQDFCFQQALAIKTAIDSATALFTTFSTREEGKIMTNVDAPINAALLADSQAQVIASAVTWQPGLRLSIYQPSS